ncbi:YfhO family protein [Raineyella fluvialis]|nr:YfhO family protein [Raineyella fluvialis]
MPQGRTPVRFPVSAARGRRWREAVTGTPGAAALAALLSVTVMVVQAVVRGEYPFGDLPRGFDDYFAQFVPYHAMFQRLLHGDPGIDAQFNWFVGLGQPFLPDYAVYLGGPWTLLIGLFPVTRVELGMVVVTLLKVAMVAASMVVYLRIAHGAGHPVLAAVVGTAYATSGFILEEGLYDPMWLEGVAAFPLIALVGHWCRTGRHAVPSVLLIALLYWSNFYSAIMATIGAVYLTLVMALVDRLPPRRLGEQLGRLAVRGLLGVGLTLPLVLPGVLAGTQAPPLDMTYGPRNVPLWRYLSKLFSLTELLDFSPGLAIGTLLLIAALAFFAHRRIPLRERLTLGLGLVVMFATMSWDVTRLVWFGFTEPHGSFFRNAFVVSGFLLVLAWRFLLRPPPGLLATVLGGGAVLAVLGWLTLIHHRGPHHAWSTPLTVVMVLAAVAGVAVMAIRPGTRRVVGPILVSLLVLELGLNAVVVEQLRASVRQPMGRWYADADRDLALVREHRASGQGWPPYRLDDAAYWYGNQSGLLGEPGVRYYSSTFTAQSARVFADLGVPSLANGRLMGPTVEDAPLFALLGVSARLEHPEPGRSRVSTYRSFPLVRVAPPARPSVTGVASVFAHRDGLWDEQVYTAPVWATRPATDGAVVPAGNQTRLAGTCPAGGVLQADLRPAGGAVTLRTSGSTSGGQRVDTPAPDERPAPVTVALPATGAFDLAYVADNRAPQPLALDRFACFDAARAAGFVDAAQRDSPGLLVHGRHLEATWPHPVSGDVIVSTTAVDGWSCDVDGQPARIIPARACSACPCREPAASPAATRRPCSRRRPPRRSSAWRPSWRSASSGAVRSAGGATGAEHRPGPPRSGPPELRAGHAILAAGARRRPFPPHDSEG